MHCLKNKRDPIYFNPDLSYFSVSLYVIGNDGNKLGSISDFDSIFLDFGHGIYYSCNNHGWKNPINAIKNSGSTVAKAELQSKFGGGNQYA
jgi:hypothetical protein